MIANWSRITESAPWPPRDSPGAAVFRNRIWLLGGWQMLSPGNFPRLNDVWRSADGATWECVLRAAPWPARNLGGCVVLDDRIWLMGGFDGVHTFGDVWCSDDGDRWDLVEKRSPWAPRAMFPAIEYRNRIWILGGGNYHDRGVNYNDVWCSPDGQTWDREAVDAGWGPRRFHSSFIHAGRMWIAGGAIEPSINVNDVWCSEEGRTWRQSIRCAPWGVRHAFACLDFQRRIWLLGGYSGSIAGSVVYNDVWTLESPDSADGAETA